MTPEQIEALPEAITLSGEWETRTILLNDEWLPEDLSLKIRPHSPTGFNWSYAGSGPAQLALAVLMEFLPVRDALHYYQDFKFEVIAMHPKSDFSITINLKEKITRYAEENIRG